MLVYEGTKKDFMDSTYNETIADEIKQNILKKLGRHTPDSEFHSWIESLNYMYKVMGDEAIPNDSGIAIEYNIPQTAKRVDFMISGYDENGNAGMIIVELKRWSAIKAIPNSSTRVKIVRAYESVHPSYQAWSYKQFIKDYNSNVQAKNVLINACACLHNYVRKDNDPLDDKQYSVYIAEAYPYTSGQINELRNFIKKLVKKGDNKKILYELDHGKIKPSKNLQDEIKNLLAIDRKKRREFILLDEQRVSFEQIIEIAQQSKNDNKKRTIICVGGPGTGKSVIAVQLLAHLTDLGHVVQYVSKNAAPRRVYKAKLKGDIKVSSIDYMFKSSGIYYDVDRNVIDTLLVDEAHRLNAKSGYHGSKGENQIKEIINASKCSVFFIDESQRVTLEDIGSIKEIKHWAKTYHSEVTEMELKSQFRCNGSDGYLSWLDNVLEIKETGNFDLKGINYDFRVIDNPNELRKLIVEKNAPANKARILAGYCWDWPKRTRSNTNFHDIKIGDFEISWNLEDGDAFAISKTSINEAGCIHTAQGLDFDYVGVIIGPDMRYEDDHILTDYTKRAKADIAKSLKGIKKIEKQNKKKAQKLADEIIKNTYRTLMTRGRFGCYVYCVDPELAKYLKMRLELGK